MAIKGYWFISIEMSRWAVMTHGTLARQHFVRAQGKLILVKVQHLMFFFIIREKIRICLHHFHFIVEISIAIVYNNSFTEVQKLRLFLINIIAII